MIKASVALAEVIDNSSISICEWNSLYIACLAINSTTARCKKPKEQMLITGNKWLNIQTPLKKRHWNLTCRLSSHKSEEIIMNLAKARVEAVRNSASAYFPGLVQTAQISGLGTIQNISYIEPRIEISRFSFYLSTSFQLECSQSLEENFHIFFNQQCLPCQEEVSWGTGN